MTVSQKESERMRKKYQGWGMLESESTESRTNTQGPFMNDDSTMLEADRNYELTDIFADRVNAPEDLERQPSMPIERIVTDESGSSYIQKPLNAAHRQQGRAETRMR